MRVLRNHLKQLGDIFWTFARMSPLAFGGGYAMLPIIDRVMVRERSLVSEQEMSDIVSIAGSAPGGVGVNTSAYLGYRSAGVCGAFAAVAGITLPAFLIVISASMLLVHFQDVPKVEAALKGIHGAVIALIAYAAYQMIKRSVFDRTTLVLLIVTTIALLSMGIHPIFTIIGGITAGITWIGIKKARHRPVCLEKHPSEKKEKSGPQASSRYSDYDMAEGI